MAGVSTHAVVRAQATLGIDGLLILRGEVEEIDEEEIADSEPELETLASDVS